MINSKEIDWHFKDKNHTTTILSYGLQLQVTQPVLFTAAADETGASYLNRQENNQEEQDFYDLHRNLNGYERGARNVASPSSMLPQRRVAKYRVTSDRALNHVLTVYVQGAQDEGAYQCIDSKSETPIKKNIYVYLSKNIFENKNIL